MKKILKTFVVLSFVSIITSNIVSCNNEQNQIIDNNPPKAASLDWDNKKSFDYIGDNYKEHDINWWIQTRDSYTASQSIYSLEIQKFSFELDTYQKVWSADKWDILIPHGWYQCEIAHANLMINILKNKDLFKNDIQKMSFDKNDSKTWWLKPYDFLNDYDNTGKNKELLKKEINWYKKVYELIKGYVITVANNDPVDENYQSRSGSKNENYWLTKIGLNTYTELGLEKAKRDHYSGYTDEVIDNIEKAINDWTTKTFSFDQKFQSFLDGFAVLNDWFNDNTLINLNYKLL